MNHIPSDKMAAKRLFPLNLTDIYNATPVAIKWIHNFNLDLYIIILVLLLLLLLLLFMINI